VDGRAWRVSLAFLLLLAAGPGEAGARAPGVTEATLLWRTSPDAALAPAPVLATDVRLRITGIVARAVVRQEFANPAPSWAEGVYVFPLPEDAAVDRLRMRVGDRTIEGVVRERQAAGAAYVRARQQGQRASLVEQERPNVFTTSVANIPPGAAIGVEIEYQQTVRRDAGRFSVRVPMVVGPRFVPGTPVASTSASASTPGHGWAADTDEVPDASRVTPPVRHPARGPINPVRLRIELDPGMPLASLRSTHHGIVATPLAGDRHEITLADGEVPADRDFELVWRPAAGGEPTAALLAERGGDEVYALVMLMPPTASREAPRIPREAVFVIDVSGSMHGASIEQARAALRLALARLQPGDTFNVIRFNDRTESLFPAAEPVDPRTLAVADRHVAGLRAGGGTQIVPALLRALDVPESPGRLRQVVFLTDGAVGNEAAALAAVRERLGASRLFTIGIGSAPNSHLMREAARLGRGTFTYIGTPEEVEARMRELLAKLEAPAVTDLQLEIPGVPDGDILPSPIPDLYAGEPVVVAVRAGALPPFAVLRGRLGDEAWAREVPLHQVGEGAGLGAHWARARIAGLLDRRGHGAPETEIRHAVLDLALRHHLVSPYTSLVAVDVTPARAADEPLASHALETNLPHGWDHTAVFGAGQGATAAPLHLVLGLAALLLASATMAIARRLTPAPARRRR
jgi:Ca-activated chloride channel family protein